MSRVDVIIAKLGKKAKESEGQSKIVGSGGLAEDEYVDGDGLSSIAEEIIDAVKSGDTELLVEALQAFMSECKD